MKPVYLTLLAAALTGISHAALYSSDANFNITTNSTMDQVNWVGAYGNTASPTPVYNNMAGISGTYRVGVFNGDSGATNPQLNDYLFFQKAGSIGTPAETNVDFFTYTGAGAGFTAFDPDIYSGGLNATWRKNGETASLFVAMQITGGDWYASTTNSYSANGNASFDYLASSWVAVSDTGSTLSLDTGATFSYADLFSGANDANQITGFGFYVQGLLGNASAHTIRLDDIQIVPEPSSALLALCGISSFALRRRR